MPSLVVASHVGLWVISALLVLVVSALARQIGLLHRRLPPTGAAMEAAGPEIGEPAPAIDATDILHRPVSLNLRRPRATLLVFVSPTCPTCRDLLPAVRSIARSERGQLQVVVVSLKDDTDGSHRDYMRTHGLGDVLLVASSQLAKRYQIWAPPYAVLVGPDGRVQAKGVVNHMEHLDSLLTMARLSVATPDTTGVALGQTSQKQPTQPSQEQPIPRPPGSGRRGAAARADASFRAASGA